MGMTRLQLRTAVIENTARSDKATLINSAINLALDEATMRHAFKKKQVEIEVAVAVDDTEFPLPEGVNTLVSVSVQNEDGNTFHELCIKSKYWLEKRFPGLSSSVITSGTPAYAYEENGIVKFMPPAANAYTMKVTGWTLAGTMSEDTDQTTIPGIDQFVIAWVTGWIFGSIEQLENAMFWNRTAEKALLVAIRNDKDRPAVELQASEFGSSKQTEVIDPYSDPFAGLR